RGDIATGATRTGAVVTDVDTAVHHDVVADDRVGRAVDLDPTPVHHGDAIAADDGRLKGPYSSRARQKDPVAVDARAGRGDAVVLEEESGFESAMDDQHHPIAARVRGDVVVDDVHVRRTAVRDLVGVDVH